MTFLWSTFCQNNVSVIILFSKTFVDFFSFFQVHHFLSVETETGDLGGRTVELSNNFKKWLKKITSNAGHSLPQGEFHPLPNHHFHRLNHHH
jgi:hypothetical protein